MKIRTIYEFESDDLARPQHLDTVVSMLGIDYLPDVEGTRGRKAVLEAHPYRKVFNRLRNNLADDESLAEAGRIIEERVAELRARADTDRPFADARVNADFADGLRATADLAVREWKTFQMLMAEDLRNARG
jgi:hypothetical protein